MTQAFTWLHYLILGVAIAGFVVACASHFVQTWRHKGAFAALRDLENRLVQLETKGLGALDGDDDERKQKQGPSPDGGDAGGAHPSS